MEGTEGGVKDSLNCSMSSSSAGKSKGEAYEARCELAEGAGLSKLVEEQASKEEKGTTDKGEQLRIHINVLSTKECPQLLYSLLA